MNPHIEKLLLLAMMLAGLVQIQVARAAVSFTVTPSVVSNSFSGYITLQISGLTNGETVVIQRFLDVNTNGVIDTNDLMVQDFQLTAGQTEAMVIGGVTNVNVPFNSSTNTNAITATLNFQSGVFSQTLVGQYLFKLSSTVGQFTPITNQFSVTNSYSQQFTGRVVNGASAVPNAVVLLLPASDPAGNALIPGAVANNSGVYTVQAPVGTYTLVAFKNNFVADVTAAANLALTNGQNLTTNMSLIPATESISGRCIDAATSNGLPGVLVLMNAGNFVGVCFTDTNGDFNAGATANDWNINGLDAAVALLGYVGLNNGVSANATSGSVTNVNIPAYKATALFYGYLTNSSGPPFPGVALEAEDINKVYDSFGTTAANGYYVVAALGGLATNAYTVDIASADLYLNYIFSWSSYNYCNGGTNLATNTAVPQNFADVNTGLVLNGGFETGDFTDWTLSGVTNEASVGDVCGFGISAYFGRYEAVLGTPSSFGYLSQTLPTTIDASYLISFWLDNPYRDPGEFTVSWNGNMLLNTGTFVANNWTNLQFLVPATGMNTVLQFGFEGYEGNLFLDDIGVQEVPPNALPAIANLSLSGTNLMINGSNGLSGVKYSVLMSTNLTLPFSQWTPVATNTWSSNGNFNFTVTNAVNSSIPKRFYVLQVP